MYPSKIFLTLGFLYLAAGLPAAEPVEPMTLAACQAYAFEHSPALARQRLTYSNLVESVQIAIARYDPVLRVSREWREEEDPGLTRGQISQTLPADLQATLSAENEDRDDGSYTQYAITLSKTLLGGGSLLEGRLPLERAWIQEAAQANTLSLEQRLLRLTVTRSYYAVVRNQLTLRLRELQVERARRNLEHALVKEDPLDIATAQLRIPESELNVISAQRAIHIGLLDLAILIGKPVSEPIQVTPVMAFEVRKISPEEDQAYALENHERILNARLDLRLKQMESKVADTRRRPEVRVEASLRENEAEDKSDLQGALVLEWPWLDRADRATARQRRHDLDQSALFLYEAEQGIAKEVESLAVRLREGERIVILQEERVKVLEQQYRLYEDRWQNGESNILEFVRSQNELENARVQLVAEQTRYLELRAEYDFLIGR